MLVDPIIQTKDSLQHGMSVRSLFGLNVFTANDVPLAAEQDPRYIFLQSLSQQVPSSAHAGSLAFEGDAPLEFFGLTEQTFIQAPIGIYGSTFYYSETEPVGCFFPDARDIYRGRQAKNLQYLVTCDALAIYVEPVLSAGDKMRNLLNKSIENSQEWLQQMTHLYSIVLFSHADGWHFTAYSRESASFQLLDTPLQQAQSAIETSPWYMQNKARLRWNPLMTNAMTA